MTDVHVLSPTGEPFTVDESELPLVQSQGYSLEAPEATINRHQIRQYVKDNDNILGSIKVLGSQFADEFLGGLPETILEHNSTDLENAKRAALKKSHNVANTLGGVGGFATSMILPIGVLGKVSEGASLLGKSASKAIEAGIGAENLVGKLGSKAVSTLAATGIEGASATAPQAISHLIDGDAEQAGETMLIGALLGMTSAPLHLLNKEILPAVSGGARKYKQDVTDFVSEQAGSIGAKAEMAKDLTAEKIKEAASSAAIKAAKSIAKDAGTSMIGQGVGALAGAKLGSVLGPIGTGVGAMAGYAVGKTLEPVIEKGAQAVFAPAAKKLGEVVSSGYERTKFAGQTFHMFEGAPLGERLAMAKEALFSKHPGLVEIDEALLEKAVKEHGFAMRLGDKVVDQFNKLPGYIKSLQTGVNVYSKARHVAATGAAIAGIDLINPGDWDRHIKQINGIADAPPIMTDSPYESALNNQQKKATQYLQANLPPIDLNPKPFEQDVTLPPKAKLQPYKDKLAVVMNPFTALERLSDGTLNVNHMDALTKVYPKIYEKMKQDIVLLGMEKQNKKISADKRRTLGIFMGQPMGNSFNPQFMQLTQQMYQKAKEPAKPANGSIKLKLPSQASDVQRIASGSRQ